MSVLDWFGKGRGGTFVGSLRICKASRPRWRPSRAMSMGGGRCCCCGTGAGGDVEVEARRLRRLLLPILRVEDTLDVEVLDDTVDEQDDTLRPPFSIFGGVPTPGLSRR